MATDVSHGSHTGDGTLTTVVTDYTTAGIYQVRLDLADLALGEYCLCEIHTKAQHDGTLRLIESARYENVQAIPIVDSRPIISPTNITVKLQVTTGAVILWTLMSP